MDRSGQGVLDHLFFLQVGEGRVKLPEVVEVFENRFHDHIDNLVGNIGGGDESGADAESVDVAFVVVHAGRDDGFTVIGAVGDQRIDFGTRRIDELRIAGGNRFLR